MEETKRVNSHARKHSSHTLMFLVQLLESYDKFWDSDLKDATSAWGLVTEWGHTKTHLGFSKKPPWFVSLEGKWAAAIAVLLPRALQTWIYSLGFCLVLLLGIRVLVCCKWCGDGLFCFKSFSLQRKQLLGMSGWQFMQLVTEESCT